MPKETDSKIAVPTYPTCIFCGKNTAKPSKEHVIPQWLTRLFPDVTWEITDRETNKTFRSRGRIELITRRPCKDCNSGWLSKIENAAKRILPTLIDGTPTTLGPDAQRSIALWFFARAIMFDLHAEKKRPRYFEPYERRALMEGRVFDARYNFYLAQYRGAMPGITQEDHLTLAFTDADNPSPQGSYPTLRAYTLTFVIKQLVLQIFCLKRPVDRRMVYYMPDFTPACARLFSADAIAWPPPRYFNDAGIDDFIFRWQMMVLPPP